MNVEVLEKVRGSKKGILVVNDSPSLWSKTNIPGVLRMNISSECYDLLFSQHGASLFSLPCVQQAPKEWQQVLQFCQDAPSSVRSRTGIARVRGRYPVHLPGYQVVLPAGVLVVPAVVQMLKGTPYVPVINVSCMDARVPSRCALGTLKPAQIVSLPAGAEEVPFSLGVWEV